MVALGAGEPAGEVALGIVPGAEVVGDGVAAVDGGTPGVVVPPRAGVVVAVAGDVDDVGALGEVVPPPPRRCCTLVPRSELRPRRAETVRPVVSSKVVMAVRASAKTRPATARIRRHGSRRDVSRGERLPNWLSRSAVRPVTCWYSAVDTLATTLNKAVPRTVPATPK